MILKESRVITQEKAILKNVNLKKKKLTLERAKLSIILNESLIKAA